MKNVNALTSADPVQIETKEQLAARYWVVPRTIENWTKAGWLPCLKIGKSVRYNSAVVDQSIAQRFARNLEARAQ